MIAIIDYGLGNVRAIANVYNNLEIPAAIVKDPENVKKADKIILPGVGAFDQAIHSLEESGFRKILDDIVLNRYVPILGICVGMQMLARSSEEGNAKGLGWIDAEVKRFDFSSTISPPCVPHMGWNDVEPVRECVLFHGLDREARFYFLHSYFMDCRKPENVIALTDYSGPFACAVNAENVYGVQFHPEKSHGCGIQLLKNFAEI